jgi:hypothetical protein
MPLTRRRRLDDSVLEEVLVTEEDPAINLFDSGADKNRRPVEPEETESQILEDYEDLIPDETQLLGTKAREERSVCCFYSSPDNEEALRVGEEGLLASDVRHADLWEEVLDRFEDRTTLNRQETEGLVGLLLDCYEKMHDRMKKARKKEIDGAIPSIGGLGDQYRKDVVVQAVQYATSKAGLTSTRQRELISLCYPERMDLDGARRYARDITRTYFSSEEDERKVRCRVNYRIKAQNRSIIDKEAVSEIVMGKIRDYLVEKCPETIRGKNNLAMFVGNILSTYYRSQESACEAEEDVLGGILLMDRKRRAFCRTEAITAIGKYLSAGPMRTRYESCGPSDAD